MRTSVPKQLPKHPRGHMIEASLQLQSKADKVMTAEMCIATWSSGFTPPCPRAAKEGFSFGGGSSALHLAIVLPQRVAGWHNLRPQPLDPRQSLQE